MNFTKKDICIALIITFTMLILGFMIGDKVRENATETAKIYNTAIKILRKDVFDYAISTSQGNIITGGYFQTVDPVSYPEYAGEYSFIRKNREEYTRHERTYTDENGKTQTEVYWTWDFTGSWYKKSGQVILFDNKFSTDKFDLMIRNTHKYVYKGSHVRFYYEVADTNFFASFIAKAENNDIKPIFSDKITLTNKQVDELGRYGENYVEDTMMRFWVVFIFVIFLANGAHVYFINYRESHKY